MKKLLLLYLLLLSAYAGAQVYTPTHDPIATGGTWDVPNKYGATVTSWEEVPSGSPSGVTVTIQGCMRGGTCDSAADSNTSTSATIRGVTFGKVYGYFHIAVTLSGGTNPTITINPEITTARLGGFGGIGGVIPAAILSANYTNSTTGMTDVTGLSVPVAANTDYKLECHLYYQGSASTAGLLVQFTGPASPTAVKVSYFQPLTASTYNLAVVTAFAASMGVTTAITATTNFEAVVRLGLRNGATAGTVQLQGAAAGAGTVTIGSASWCS